MAFASSVIWEVRSTGNAANGGGFDPTSGTPGTDFSQQNAAQIAYTDMVIGATTTQFTSVANSPAASLVGNIINVTGGTGFTVQRVQVLSVAAGVATCDKSLGTTASTGGTGNMGGSLANPANAASLVVAGNIVYIKNTATYTTASTITYSTAGTSGNPISIVGYGTTRGDNIQITWQNTASGIAGLSATGGQMRVLNIIFDGNSQAVARGLSLDGNQSFAINCKAINCATSGFRTQGNVTLINCWAKSNSGPPFQLSAGTRLIGCIAESNTAAGFQATAACNFIRCIAYSNTGASSDGFSSTVAGSSFLNCTAHTNGRDGIRLSGAAAADGVDLLNNILVSNSGYGVNSTTTNITPALTFSGDYNFYYNNTLGARNQIPVGPHDVTGTGDPCTAAASLNFALNNTSGAGAAARAAGWPGLLQAGGTGYEDLGALQHQDSGSSGMLFIPNMEGT